MAGNDNLIKIVFEGETSSATQAFSKVNSELAETSKHLVNWTKLTKDHAEAQEFMRGTVGKTAADFKPATAAMREASVAVEDLGRKGTSGVGAFRGAMRALHFDIFEVVAALGLMVKAFDEAGKSESSERHIANQGITGDFGSAASAENFDPSQYQKAAIALKVAGLSANELLGDVTELGKASRIAGVPFEKLVDTAAAMSEEIETGGIPSLSQMNTMTLASSGVTQGLADEYRELAKTLIVTEQQWKLEEEAQARVHKKTEEQTSAATNFADKIGLSAKVFQAFATQTSYAAGMGEGMMSGKLTKEYSEGLAQLTQESGMSTQQIREFMTAGKVGYQDLISASGRYRSHQQEELEFTQKQRDEHLRLDTEARDRALGLAALKSVMAPSDWKNQEAELQKASPEGLKEKIQAQATGAMVALGNAIVTWFPQLKAAILVLAGVEVASKLAALNSRFFPNMFPGAPSDPAAPAASGGIMEMLKKIVPVAALASVFNSIPDSTGKEAEYWKQHPDLKRSHDLSTANKPFVPEIFGIPLYGPSDVPIGGGAPLSGGSPSGASKPGSGEPSKVEDKTLHDLVERLLAMLAGSSS